MAELGVEPLAVLADEPARQLGELVIAQDQVDPLGILALERGDDVQELVRPLPLLVRILSLPWINSCKTR